MKTSQNSAASSSTPIIHVHMPNTTAPSHASPSAIVPACADTLVTHQKIGPNLSTDDFCRIYSLGNEILGRLKDNGYQRARTFFLLSSVRWDSSTERSRHSRMLLRNGLCQVWIEFFEMTAVLLYVLCYASHHYLFLDSLNCRFMYSSNNLHVSNNLLHRLL